MTTDLLTLEDVADRLGKSRDWCLRRAQRGEIPHRRVGRDYRFTEGDLREYLDWQRVAPADPLQSVVTRRKSA